MKVLIQERSFLIFYLKLLLSQGVNFLLPNKKVETSKNLCPFQLLYEKLVILITKVVINNFSKVN